jgi:hypothetical protein
MNMPATCESAGGASVRPEIPTTGETCSYYWTRESGSDLTAFSNTIGWCFNHANWKYDPDGMEPIDNTDQFPRCINTTLGDVLPPIDASMPHNDALYFGCLELPSGTTVAGIGAADRGVPTINRLRGYGCAAPSCWSVGCPSGYVCSAEGVCVIDDPPPPTACESDAQCAAGEYCVNQMCEQTAVCASDDQCPIGQTCDESRSTCVPDSPPPPPTPAACSSYTDQASCEARPDCRAIIGGTNCQRPDGSSCQPGDAGCTCEPPFVFMACVTR